MKIAFDVQGTLQGRYSDRVVKLFNKLQELGHECSIWSFGGSMMARDAETRAGVKANACMSKSHKEYDVDTSGNRVPLDPEFDFCIDDDRTTAETLDAKRVIYVEQIPEVVHEERWTRFMKDVFNA
jgi:hypothetical protein